MSMGGLIGETFIQSELEARRERAMQQYHRRPRRHPKRRLGWPFKRRTWGQRHHGRPAVS